MVGSIEVLNDHQVIIDLDGQTRSQFLREAQELCLSLRLPDLVRHWEINEGFMSTTPSLIAVDGNVPSGVNKTRKQQEELGLCNVSLADLYVASVAYYVATGRDLFQGRIIRARDGGLTRGREGIELHLYEDDMEFGFGACAALTHHAT